MRTGIEECRYSRLYRRFGRKLVLLRYAAIAPVTLPYEIRLVQGFHIAAGAGGLKINK
jgi:hypothetical protein